MRQRLHLLLVLVAWLMATGSHWDLLQTFAWTRMTWSYAQDMPVLEAVQETFNPENLCSLCKVVRDAKENGADTMGSGAKLDGKILLLLPALNSERIVAMPASVWSPVSMTMPESLRTPPPHEPPRSAVA